MLPASNSTDQRLDKVIELLQQIVDLRRPADVEGQVDLREPAPQKQEKKRK